MSSRVAHLAQREPVRSTMPDGGSHLREVAMKWLHSDWTRAGLIVSGVFISAGLTVGLAIKSPPRPTPSFQAASQPERTTSVPPSLSSEPADQPERTTSAPVDRSPILPVNLIDPLG